MFDTLSARLDGIFKKLRSRGKLHPKQVDNALTEMRPALLEADVAVEVADDLLERVRLRALSEEVMKSLTPAQQVIKVVRDELQTTMGGTQAPFSLPGAKPAIVMMAGGQGSGEQLMRLGREMGVDVVPDGKEAGKVAKAGLKHADLEGYDVVIVDTAG